MKNKNFTITIAVTEVKPIVFIENNKINIQIKEFQNVIDLFPKGITLLPKASSNFEVGSLNKTGHYNGVLGMVQSNVADAAFYPIPIDITAPPGRFTYALYEGGIQLMSLTRQVNKKQADLFNAILNFDLQSAFLIMFFYLVVTYFIYNYFFNKENEVLDSFFLVYRIMFKEHYIPLKINRARIFLVFILIYYLFLIIIIETSTNTNLVVTPVALYIETIDDLYDQLSTRKPNFIKDHFSNDYFISHGNKKAEEIFRRAENYGTVLNTNALLAEITKDLKNEIDYSFVVISEDQLVRACKKIICNKDFKLVLDTGVIHVSKFVFKTLFSILFNKNLDKNIKNYIDTNIIIGIEAGLTNKFLSNIYDSDYGYLKNPNTGFKECISMNFLRKIEDPNFQLKLKNIYKLSSGHCIFCLLIFFTYIFSWIYCLLKLRKLEKNLQN